MEVETDDVELNEATTDAELELYSDIVGAWETDGFGDDEEDGSGVSEGAGLTVVIIVFVVEADTDDVELSEADTDAEPELTSDTVGA